MTGTIELSLACWAYMALAAYLFVHGVCVLNFMTKRTPVPQRLGYSLLTVGVGAAMIGPLYGYYEPHPSELLVYFGLSVYHTSRAIRIWRVNVRRTQRSKQVHS